MEIPALRPRCQRLRPAVRPGGSDQTLSLASNRKPALPVLICWSTFSGYIFDGAIGHVAYLGRESISQFFLPEPPLKTARSKWIIVARLSGQRRVRADGRAAGVSGGGQENRRRA
jgi:hypothetical protein